MSDDCHFLIADSLSQRARDCQRSQQKRLRVAVWQSVKAQEYLLCLHELI